MWHAHRRLMTHKQRGGESVGVYVCVLLCVRLFHVSSCVCVCSGVSLPSYTWLASHTVLGAAAEDRQPEPAAWAARRQGSERGAKTSGCRMAMRLGCVRACLRVHAACVPLMFCCMCREGWCWLVTLTSSLMRGRGCCMGLLRPL